MTRPRILKVVRPVEGGIQVHLKNLLENLSGYFDFTVACPEQIAADFNDLDVRVYPVPLTKELQPVEDLKTVMCLSRMLRREAFALVHAHGFKAGLVARPAARLNRTPCLVTVHNDFAHARAAKLRAGYFLAERILSRWTSRYITVSEWLASDLSATCGVHTDNIMVIPNGISLLCCETEPDYGFPFGEGLAVVGTVARLAPQKGVEYFVRAAAELKQTYSRLHFLVIGDGPLRSELELLADQLGLSGRIAFWGRRPDVRSILSRLAVFVQPSLSEGQGITVLEAMAEGCPVVASAAGGLREIVINGENGLSVNPGNVQELAAAVAALLNDSKLAEALAKRARSDIARFDLSCMLESTKTLYEKVMKL